MQAVRLALSHVVLLMPTIKVFHNHQLVSSHDNAHEAVSAERGLAMGWITAHAGRIDDLLILQQQPDKTWIILKTIPADQWHAAGVGLVCGSAAHDIKPDCPNCNPHGRKL